MNFCVENFVLVKVRGVMRRPGESLVTQTCQRGGYTQCGKECVFISHAAETRGCEPPAYDDHDQYTFLLPIIVFLVIRIRQHRLSSLFSLLPQPLLKLLSLSAFAFLPFSLFFTTFISHILYHRHTTASACKTLAHIPVTTFLVVFLCLSWLRRVVASDFSLPAHILFLLFGVPISGQFRAFTPQK